VILPRRVTYALVSVVVTLGVLYRYPLGLGHEAGSDTTFIHSLANALIAKGSAAWILHPLSYFGLYALSYPSAMPFLFGSVSEASGIPVEGAILVTGFAFSTVGALSAFAATRSLREDDGLALIVALLFSVAPFYLKDTTWVGSGRGFVTALVPAVFFLLLRNLRTRDPRLLILSGLLVVLLAAIHRMGILALFLLIAFGFAVPFHRLTQRLRFALTRYETPFRWASSGIALSGFFSLFYVQFLFPGIAGADVVEEYGNGVLFHGSSYEILLANMAVSLVGKVGLLLPFVVVGVVRLTAMRPKEDRDKFLLVAIFVMIPLLSLRDYIAEFLIYLFVLFVVLAVLPYGKAFAKRKAVAAILVTALVGSAMLFSWVAKDYWKDAYYTDGDTPDELYSAGLYALWTVDGTLAFNEGLSAGRVAAISGIPTVPVGGASIHWFSPQQLIYGFVDGQGVSVKLIPFATISFNTDEIYIPVNVPNAKDDYETIFYNHLNDARTGVVLDRYGVHYVLLYVSSGDQFQSYIWRPSPFVADVRSMTYQVFGTSSYSIWYVG
jgi:hypothetical protein